MSKTCDKWTKVRIRPDQHKAIVKLGKRLNTPIPLTVFVRSAIDSKLKEWDKVTV